MSAKDKPDTAADPLAPNEQDYRDERGGIAGVGAFRRAEGGHEQPHAASEDPEREVRGEPAFGWDPQRADRTPRSEAEYREMVASGARQEPGSTAPPVRDNDLSSQPGPSSLLDPQPWGVRPGNYAPTQGPLGPEDFDEQKNWPAKDSYGKSP